MWVFSLYCCIEILFTPGKKLGVNKIREGGNFFLPYFLGLGFEVVVQIIVSVEEGLGKFLKLIQASFIAQV